MQMTEGEIIRRYKHAADRRKQIKILAELNACPKETIREILRNAGCDVPATGNRYTAAKKSAEADGSKRKQTAEALKAEPPITASTACQPSQPVDVWNIGDVPGVIITLTKDELERINRDIAGMETEIELIQSTIDQLNFTKKELNAFLQKAEGRQS